MVGVRITVCLLKWIVRSCRRRIFIISGVAFSYGSGGLICLVVLVLKVVCWWYIIDRGWYQMEKWRIRCRITFSFTKNTNTNTNTRKRKQ